MAQQYMKWMLVSRTSVKGFTILEMMVGIAMTLTVSALALAALSNAESGFSKDKSKIEGGQKLSSVLDIVGRDIVQAGEQVNEPKFPVARIIPDPSKGSRLIVYRGLEEAISTCGAIVAGTPTSSISVASTNATVRLSNPSCSNTSSAAYSTEVQDWQDRRTATSNPTSNQLSFFLHDGLGNIQLVNLTGETNSPDYQTVGLATTSFTPTVAFPIRSTAYVMEKREYLVCNNELKVRVNSSVEGSCLTTGTSADTVVSPFKTIATNLKSLDIAVSTIAGDGIYNNSFPTSTLNWRDLRGISIKITALNPDNAGGTTSDIVASGRFYPRNILSTNAQ
jgi:hypothetical protein